MSYKIPIVLTPEPEGGYSVTSPVLPELITQGDTFEEVLVNVADCFRTVLEIYEDDGRSLPASIVSIDAVEPTPPIEALVALP